MKVLLIFMKMKEETDFNQIYIKIQELIQNGKNSISVLEDQIDVELQLEYFKQSKKILKNFNKELALLEKDELLNPNTSIDCKKELLLSLAKVDKPEAYRVIELYSKNPDEELNQWSKLALQESKMVLETSLLGKSPIFISTGLGGQGDKLRYFIVLFAKEDNEFEKWQEELIEKELIFNVQKHDGVVETVDVKGDKVLIDALLPFAVNIKDALSDVLKECNEMGDFLMKSFIVTNIKRLEPEEIQKMVDQYRMNINTIEN